MYWRSVHSLGSVTLYFAKQSLQMPSNLWHEPLLPSHWVFKNTFCQITNIATSFHRDGDCQLFLFIYLFFSIRPILFFLPKTDCKKKLIWDTWADRLLLYSKIITLFCLFVFNFLNWWRCFIIYVFIFNFCFFFCLSLPYESDFNSLKGRICMVFSFYTPDSSGTWLPLFNSAWFKVEIYGSIQLSGCVSLQNHWVLKFAVQIQSFFPTLPYIYYYACLIKIQK